MARDRPVCVPPEAFSSAGTGLGIRPGQLSNSLTREVTSLPRARGRVSKNVTGEQGTEAQELDGSEDHSLAPPFSGCSRAVSLKEKRDPLSVRVQSEAQTGQFRSPVPSDRRPVSTQGVQALSPTLGHAPRRRHSSPPRTNVSLRAVGFLFSRTFCDAHGKRVL